MKNTNYIDKNTAEKIGEIVRKEPEPTEAEAIVDYYIKNFDVIQLVTCEYCNSDLCLWILDPKQVQRNMSSHPKGMRRIVLGDKLLSSRKRLDGQMGYQCICRNDSLLSEPEKGVIPRAISNVPDMEPHFEALVKKEMAASGYKANVAGDENNYTVDNFIHKRIK